MRGRVVIDYDGAMEPIFNQINEGFDALESDTGLRVSAWRKPVTVPTLATGRRQLYQRQRTRSGVTYADEQ